MTLILYLMAAALAVSSVAGTYLAMHSIKQDKLIWRLERQLDIANSARDTYSAEARQVNERLNAAKAELSRKK